MKARDVLVPVDFSPASLHAIDAAVAVTEPGGLVMLLHVIDDEITADAEALKLKAYGELEAICEAHAAPQVRLDRLVVIGRPAPTIAHVAHDLDFSMVVMSAHGRHQRSTESQLFGSTAEHLVRLCHVPLLILPLPDRTTQTRGKAPARWRTPARL